MTDDKRDPTNGLCVHGQPGTVNCPAVQSVTPDPTLIEQGDDICAACGEKIDFRPGDSFVASIDGRTWHNGCAPSRNKGQGSAALPSEAMRKALGQAWTDFLDANPDDLTSPEEYPDHALVTCEQMIGIVEAAMRATTPTAPVQDDDAEIAWLVECPKYHPGEYFALCECGCGRHHWTTDVHKATKFSTKEEAETTRGGDIYCIAVEHQFGLRLSPTPETKSGEMA